MLWAPDPVDLAAEAQTAKPLATTRRRHLTSSTRVGGSRASLPEPTRIVTEPTDGPARIRCEYLRQDERRGHVACRGLATRRADRPTRTRSCALHRDPRARARGRSLTRSHDAGRREDQSDRAVLDSRVLGIER
jgi:hypothetical protein